MPPHDLDLLSPRPLVDADVAALNRVFAEAFTDRYRRDGMVGVRVPRLNPRVWQYALRDAGAGALVWTDVAGDLVAFNLAHQSGREGWMGPLAVRTDHQGIGLGRRIVETAVAWLRSEGARTIGLETMPRTVDNIGFYSRLGFLPGHLTVTMAGAARRDTGPGPLRLSEMTRERFAETTEECRTVLAQQADGCDFSSEIRLTRELQLGDTVIVRDAGGAIRGFVLWHSVPLVEGRSADEVRILKLCADSGETFGELIDAVEWCAGEQGLAQVAVRCQTAFPDAYAILVRRGYRVRWTDLRMTLSGFPSVQPTAGGVLLSNWEI